MIYLNHTDARWTVLDSVWLAFSILLGVGVGVAVAVGAFG